MRMKKVLPVFFGVLFLLFCPESGAAPEGPTDFIRSMLDEVLAIQNDPALQGPQHRDERRAAVKKIIGRSFDYNTMSKNALGAYWRKLGAGQQKEFTGVFQDLFQDSYTKLVLDFLKREKIVYGREVPGKDSAKVETSILRTHEKISVDYSLIRENERWLVQDVVIDGVGIVRNYQRSFSRVIERESYQALLKRMRLQQKAIESTSEKDKEPKGKD